MVFFYYNFLPSKEWEHDKKQKLKKGEWKGWKRKGQQAYLPASLFLNGKPTETAALRAYSKVYIFFPTYVWKPKNYVPQKSIYASTILKLFLPYSYSNCSDPFSHSSLSKSTFSILHAVFEVWATGHDFPHVCFQKLIDSAVQNFDFHQDFPFWNHFHNQSTTQRQNCSSTGQQTNRLSCQIIWKFKHLATSKPSFLIWHNLLPS